VAVVTDRNNKEERELLARRQQQLASRIATNNDIGASRVGLTKQRAHVARWTQAMTAAESSKRAAQGWYAPLTRLYTKARLGMARRALTDRENMVARTVAAPTKELAAVTARMAALNAQIASHATTKTTKTTKQNRFNLPPLHRPSPRALSS
jgi:hypothetical protein